MAYTTINKSTDYFNTKLFTGNGGTQAVTGVGFQPDWVWLKSRSVADSPILFDVVRGVTKRIMSNSTGAESTEAQEVQSFDSDGFTVGSSDNANRSGATMVGWNWKANGTGSSNTAGSLNSTVSVNQTAGFSIVKYTGTASNATVGHGLGSVPKMIIVKNLISTGSGAENWYVYHASLGNNKDLLLNLTNDASNTVTTWNNTTPTSSVFYIGSGDGVNKSSEANIAYCFAEKTGYSKFGSYTGNGNADGPFIYTGFKPSWIMFKKTDAAGSWYIKDNQRSGTAALQNFGQMNPNQTQYPSADTSFVENKASGYAMDILSNGFKARGTDSGINTSGGNYIYMAFAEAPLVGTNGVTAKAR